MNNYKIIDEENWDRKIHCNVFRNAIEPSYCITLELDITNFLKQIKNKKYSFTLSLIYIVSKCANEIKEFRYRFLNEKVVLFDKIDTAFTYIHKGEELFKVVNVPMENSLYEYVASATKQEKEQKEYFTGPLGNDVFQFSPLPFVSYKHISHTISGKKDNATPLFDWGKYYVKDEKVILPFSIQAHHSFVDGIHIGRLVDKIQSQLDELRL